MKRSELAKHVDGEPLVAIAPSAVHRSGRKVVVLSVEPYARGSYYGNREPHPSLSGKGGVLVKAERAFRLSGDDTDTTWTEDVIPLSHLTGETWATYEERIARERKAKAEAYQAANRLETENRMRFAKVQERAQAGGVTLASHALGSARSKYPDVHISLADLEKLLGFGQA